VKTFINVPLLFLPMPRSSVWWRNWEDLWLGKWRRAIWRPRNATPNIDEESGLKERKWCLLMITQMMQLKSRRMQVLNP